MPGHSILHANFVSRSLLLFSTIPLLEGFLISRTAADVVDRASPNV
jgi:hypothetical protein